jgi:methyl-accepting chemotaxis protein
VVQQAAAVNETTSTVEELGASSRQSADQAQSMDEAAKHSLEVTHEGIALANQVTASVTDMKLKVGSVTEQILLLSEQAGQIGGIAKVVGELAGETNMLALNAAVEAARAGEHGRGFAVVAAEVRKLADQSKKSAERANALVAEIQKATNSAVMVTEEGSATAEQVAAIIAKTIVAFGSISTTANSVAVGAQQVLLNSRQQAAALGQVIEAMKSLAAGSAQMAAGTAQTKIGVQKLNGIALDLKAMV